MIMYLYLLCPNRTNVAPGTPIRAEDLNLVRSKFDNILQNNTHATVDPTNASAFVANSAGYGRSTVWDYRLQGEHKWLWNPYNDARYFFNGGGQLRAVLPT